jgi:hypothetical protein
MAERKKARGIRVVAASVAMVVVGFGAAFAATLPGTYAGEALHGTRQVDKIYGHAGADSLYGGNEAGWACWRAASAKTSRTAAPAPTR